MITPVAAIQHVVSLLDGIVGIRSHLPPLVVAVTSADECATARGFLKGYNRRLSADGGGGLVPHALGSDRLLATLAEHSMPDVELLNQLAGQLRATMPPGAGRRWRLSLFETCHDVITTSGVQLGLVVDQRRQLLDHLYSAREERAPWLAWIQKMAASPSMPGKTLGLIATTIFSGPSRWWFGRRLNSSRWRWFGDHVKPVTGLQSDFLGHALSVVPVGALHDNAPLRRRILVEALLQDLDRLARHRRFFPHRRRRRWTPVLSLDCTAEKGLVCLDVAQSFIELTENKPTSPLLVITAMEPEALESAAGTPHPVGDAVDRLQKYVNRIPSALTSKPWLPVLLTSEPEDRAAGDWLEAHRKVTPRIPGKVSTWAPVAVTTVIAAVATVVVTYQYLFSYCADTWTNDDGERVGLSDGRCEFTPVGEDKTGRYPDLRSLEGEIMTNNEAVDSMKDFTGAPRDYRKIVFFAPLTRPSETAERTAPANALWQLRGAVAAQKQINKVATTDANSFPIKLLLANSGDQFKEGPAVASVIAEQPLTGPGSVAAVIGISQSRRVSLNSFEKMRDIPVIGSSMYGNKMTEGQENFFMVAPPNDLFAQKMTDWARGDGPVRRYTKAVIVYDPDDEYFSKDLHSSLQDYLQKEFKLLDDLILSEQRPLSDTPQSMVTTLCEDAMNGILPVLTSRADQLTKLFTAGDSVPGCSEHKITMLAGGGAIVSVASGEAGKHSWLNLAFTALAKTAAESDEANGNDALIAASEAINKNVLASGNNPSARGVLYHLSQGFTVNGKTGTFTVTPKDHKDPTSNRVRILETRPNN